MTLLEELVKLKKINKEQAESFKKIVETSGKKLEEVILAKKIIPEDFLFNLISKRLNIPFKKASPEDVSLGVMEMVPEDSARFYKMIPLDKRDNFLEIGMVYPEDLKAREALKFLARQSNFSFEVYLITPTDLNILLRKYKSLKVIILKGFITVMYNDIILYYSSHYDEDCCCSFCMNKHGLIKSLKKAGYNVYLEEFKCNWDYFYPAMIHFDYAVMFHNKMLGGFMFEAGKMPEKLIEFAETYFDYIICSSKFLASTWANSGIEKKYLVPASLGIDTDIYRVNNNYIDASPDVFKFLSVGNWQHVKEWGDRKGLEKLVKIYKEIFGHRVDTELIIKTDQYAPQSIDSDNVRVIRRKLSDNEMAKLYNTCSVNGAYISPHRGEGFGRTPLEALHCGCRVGTTGWSGVMDFANKDNATLFNYKFIDSILYDKTYYKDNKLPKFANPSDDDIKKWMLKVVKTRECNKKIPTTKEHTWDVVVDSLLKEIYRRI